MIDFAQALVPKVMAESLRVEFIVTAGTFVCLGPR